MEEQIYPFLEWLVICLLVSLFCMILVCCDSSHGQLVAWCVQSSIFSTSRGLKRSSRVYRTLTSGCKASSSTLPTRSLLLRGFCKNMSAESLTSIRRLTRFLLRTVSWFHHLIKMPADAASSARYSSTNSIVVVSVVRNPSATCCVLVRCVEPLFFDHPHISTPHIRFLHPSITRMACSLPAFNTSRSTVGDGRCEGFLCRGRSWFVCMEIIMVSCYQNGYTQFSRLIFANTFCPSFVIAYVN